MEKRLKWIAIGGSVAFVVLIGVGAAALNLMGRTKPFSSKNIVAPANNSHSPVTQPVQVHIPFSSVFGHTKEDILTKFGNPQYDYTVNSLRFDSMYFVGIPYGYNYTPHINDEIITYLSSGVERAFILRNGKIAGEYFSFSGGEPFSYILTHTTRSTLNGAFFSEYSPIQVPNNRGNLAPVWYWRSNDGTMIECNYQPLVPMTNPMEDNVWLLLILNPELASESRGGFTTTTATSQNQTSNTTNSAQRSNTSSSSTTTATSNSVVTTPLQQNSSSKTKPNSSPKMIQVPDLTGLTESQASARLSALGLSVGSTQTQQSFTNRTGTVISQDPSAGSQVVVGQNVFLAIAQQVPPIEVMNIAPAFVSGPGYPTGDSGSEMYGNKSLIIAVGAGGANAGGDQMGLSISGGSGTIRVYSGGGSPLTQNANGQYVFQNSIYVTDTKPETLTYTITDVSKPNSLSVKVQGQFVSSSQ
ncbi:PASTA domain-containing protein [Alicyclobacillus tolerans]|uniref:PASTA domain-containing protein n=1 Tax=Alicyclobacillus tolerans TaxID=90970 RepID=UPI001F18CDA6|nr:PASTA domain-containing protein [Alicyclobacillus tolerans]MCF8567720.1 PASTA domain-containing protein [Alicyclobacillus tolerans]